MGHVVVVIEDNREIAELQALALRGHVDSVQLVTERFDRALTPDLWQGVTCAIVDLMLPDVAGEDICRYLRADFPPIRRVICTAKPVMQLPGLLALADVVLQKPFLIDDLVKAVTDDPRRD